METDFYVGYEERMPEALARFVRRVVIILMLAVIALGATFASGLQPLPASRFEFGHVRSFTGRLVARPYPRLLPRGDSGSGEPGSGYLLVGPGKHGAEADVGRYDGQHVELRGTLVERDRVRAIEVVPDSVRVLASGPDEAPPVVSIGPQTLRGEIVDSKCFLGVMNPGERKVHRDCAIRCISGGIPPALLVRGVDGRNALLLLTDARGRAIGSEVATLAGLPVDVTGDVAAEGTQLWLRADVASFRKLGW